MTVNFNPKSLDAYWVMLRDLSEEARLELASRLINSLRLSPVPDKKETKSSILDRLYGAWTDEKETAEEMIERIRESRISNREMESFD